MRDHRRRYGYWTILVWQFMLASACGRARSASAALPIVPMVIDRSIPRARFVQLHGPHHGRISDFELHGDTLDLLDGADHEISEYRRAPDDDSWVFTQFVAHGPRDSAAMRTANGIARTGDTVLVVGSDAAIWKAVGGGSFTPVRADLGCLPRQPDILVMTNGALLVAGLCLDPDKVVREILWRRQADGHFGRTAADVRYAADGSLGYLFASAHPLTGTSAGALFGIGVANCLWTVDTSAAMPPHRQCPVVNVTYRSTRSADAEERTLASFRQHHHVAGVAFEWQPDLPMYLAHLRIGTVTLLARRVAADTLVVIRADVTRHDAPLLTGPAGTFVGCKREGCLWFQQSATDNLVSIVSADSLAVLLSSRSPDN